MRATVECLEGFRGRECEKICFKGKEYFRCFHDDLCIDWNETKCDFLNYKDYINNCQRLEKYDSCSMDYINCVNNSLNCKNCCTSIYLNETSKQNSSQIAQVLNLNDATQFIRISVNNLGLFFGGLLIIIFILLLSVLMMWHKKQNMPFGYGSTIAGQSTLDERSNANFSLRPLPQIVENEGVYENINEDNYINMSLPIKDSVNISEDTDSDHFTIRN